MAASGDLSLQDQNTNLIDELESSFLVNKKLTFVNVNVLFLVARNPIF